MREYINDRIGKMMEGDKFYNWCLRLLLERVTAWAEAWLKANSHPISPLSIVFAKRGGHDYDHFFSYIDLLRFQAEHGKLFLRGQGLHPRLLDRSFWEVLPAEDWAGLQMADTIASAFYQGANTASPHWDTHPADQLRPIMAATKDGVAANVGVTVWPLPHQADLPEPARAIFRNYGYGF